MKGKEKCKALKELRQKIAEENDIEYAVSECTHQGDCKGTCPKCDAELRYLERELDRRTRFGKKVALAGLSACLAGVVSGCGGEEETNIWSTFETVSTTSEPDNDYDGGLVEYIEEPQETVEEGYIEIEGEVAAPDDTEEEIIEPEGDVAAPTEPE